MSSNASKGGENTLQRPVLVSSLINMGDQPLPSTSAEKPVAKSRRRRDAKENDHSIPEAVKDSRWDREDTKDHDIAFDFYCKKTLKLSTPPTKEEQDKAEWLWIEKWTALRPAGRAALILEATEAISLERNEASLAQVPENKPKGPPITQSRKEKEDPGSSSSKRPNRCTKMPSRWKDYNAFSQYLTRNYITEVKELEPTGNLQKGLGLLWSKAGVDAKKGFNSWDEVRKAKFVNELILGIRPHSGPIVPLDPSNVSRKRPSPGADDPERKTKKQRL